MSRRPFPAGLLSLGFPNLPERDSAAVSLNLLRNSNLNVFTAKARNELDYFRFARHSRRIALNVRKSDFAEYPNVRAPKNRYSYLSATIGWMRMARRAGV
jgi:hypothetical protein